jgi:hypothetical protein
MTEQLGRRAAMVLLGSMLLGICVGLMAWGPVTSRDVLAFADTRTLLGIPNALNVLTGLVILAVALWGVRVTWRMDRSAPVRSAWLCFQASAAVGGTLAAVYHLEPSPALLLLSTALLSAGFVLLFISMLAERVHAQFGSTKSVVAALGLVACLTLVVHLSADGIEHADLRPLLLLLEIMPLLLIPAGALSLRGQGTKPADWVIVLSLYALAKLFEYGDAAIFSWSGWISGHSLMHLALAAVVAWLAHCAGRHARWAALPAEVT